MSDSMWRKEIVRGSTTPEAQENGWIKKFVKLLFALYVGYVAFHSFTAFNNSCSLQMTLMTMFPVRELYTIPMIDRAFMDSFIQPDVNPASDLTAAVGWGVKQVATDLLLTPEACVLLERFARIGGGSESNPVVSRGNSKAAPRPYATPFQRRFARQYGKLTEDSVVLYAGVSDAAKQTGRCTNPSILQIMMEYDERYFVHCDGASGYIDKNSAHLVDHLPAAKLVVQAAFLYAQPKLSSKPVALCHPPDIHSVAYYRNHDGTGFYYVMCDETLGWIEAKHIQIVDS